MLPGFATGTAEFSPNGVYRYWLTRDLGGTRPLVSCGLNPSTATAEDPDPTIDKECKYTRSWGYGLLVKVNMYGYVETKPAKMWAHAAAGVDIVGPGNDACIVRAARLVLERDGMFLGAWGRHAKPDRVRQVLELLASVGPVPIWCIKSNKDGSPIHPLYQLDAAKPQIWKAA